MNEEQRSPAVAQPADGANAFLKHALRAHSASPGYLPRAAGNKPGKRREASPSPMTQMTKTVYLVRFLARRGVGFVTSRSDSLGHAPATITAMPAIQTQLPARFNDLCWRDPLRWAPRDWAARSAFPWSSLRDAVQGEAKQTPRSARSKALRRPPPVSLTSDSTLP